MIATCRQCGAPVRAGAMEGLCQDCLGKAALGGDPLEVERSEKPFGDYELLEEIAHGGMGVVYKARQLSLSRTVAVKLIRAGVFASKEFVHRFRVEASAAAVLQHPNIVAVHEVGVHEGQHFFSMDYVAGKNLAQIVRDGPLPPPRAARYVQRIAEAIHYAHQSGILHRDLKPSNVLIDQNDQPRITDFGLAKQLNSESSATLTGEVMGTPGYMPPEQASGNRGAVKAWSDVYSLGAVLYHLLTGRAPFAAGSLEETLNQVLHKDPVSLRLLNPAVPKDLNTICLKCLEKEPAKRYGSAQLLAEELTRFLNQEPIQARPLSAVGKAARWCKRKPASAIALGLLVVVAIGSPIAALRINRARHAEQYERQRAQTTVTKLEIAVAENLFQNDKGAKALAYLARVLRREPHNRVAAERILSALSYRNFCLPIARLRHNGDVTAAQFSSDSRQVLTACRDKSARIWDSFSGRLLTEFNHPNGVLTAQFSPDGKSVVTAAGDEMVRIWDVRAEKLVLELRHPAPVLSAAFSANGRKIVTGGTDGSVCVWSLGATNIMTGSFQVRSPAQWVQFSTDETLVAIMSWGRPGAWVATTWLVDTVTGVPVAIFPNSVYSPDATMLPCLPQFNWAMSQAIVGNNRSSTRMPASLWTLKPTPAPVLQVAQRAMIHATALSPDGTAAATGSQDNTAQLWDTRTGQPIAGPLRHQDWLLCLEFSPDGRQLATGANDNTARLWSVDTGESLCEPLQHQSSVSAVHFSGDGQRLLTRCLDGSVWIWPIRSRRSIPLKLPHASNVRMGIFSPLNGHVGTGEWLGRIMVWSPAVQQSPIASWSTKGPGQSQSIQFSPDGRWLAVARTALAGDAGSAQIWNVASGNPTPTVLSVNRIDVGVACVRFNPTSEYLVTSGNDTNATVWELSTERVVSHLSHRAESHFARFSPDGQSVLTASYDKTAQLWDWRNGQPRFAKALSHDDRVVWADISPDNRWIVTLSRDKNARIWDARTGELRMPPLPHAEEPYHYNSIEFSPDGRYIVAAAGNTAQVWNSATGQPLSASLKHSARVNSVRFSPDSRRVVTASVDGAARVWDAETGHVLGEPYQHKDRVNYAEFSPDGRWLLTASVDATARLWELPQLRGAIPSWLPELAEAISRQRLQEGDASEVVPFEKLARLRQAFSNTSSTNELTPWLRWLLNDEPARTLSPSSPIAVSAYVNARLREETSDSLQEAFALSPTNPGVQAKLAFAEMTNRTGDLRQMARADWTSQRARLLAPDDGDVLLARAQICERLGKLTEALEHMTSASSLNSSNAAFWNSWGQMYEKTNRLDDALRCYNRAIELAGSWKDSYSLPATAWLNRSRLFRSMNRLADAAADNLAALNLTPRDPETPLTLIDLSLHYNVSQEMKPVQGSIPLLAGLPLAQTNLAGIDFDARGVIQLAGVLFDNFPQEILGIRVGQRCRSLQFLHGTLIRALEGMPIGVYRVHYVDGQALDILIRYGEDVRSRFPENDPGTTSRATGFLSKPSHIRYYKKTWDNPRPDKLIASIDFLFNGNGSAPFLIALTAEP